MIDPARATLEIVRTYREWERGRHYRHFSSWRQFQRRHHFRSLPLGTRTSPHTVKTVSLFLSNAFTSTAGKATRPMIMLRFDHFFSFFLFFFAPAFSRRVLLPVALSFHSPLETISQFVMCSSRLRFYYSRFESLLITETSFWAEFNHCINC